LRTFGLWNSGTLKDYSPRRRQDYSKTSDSTAKYSGACRTDIPRLTTLVGTRTDYCVGPWDYSTWAAGH
jgi:hypothetical protein